MSACMLCSCKIENVEQVVSVLKGVWETVLTGLFPQLPKHVLEKHLICDMCYDHITRLKTFKIRCQTVENEIIAYGKTHNTELVNLKDIKQGTSQELPEDARLCRTCLRKVDNTNWEAFDQTSLHYPKFTTFNINLNLDLVSDSIICHYCTEYLHRLTRMHQKCLQLVSEHQNQTILPTPFVACDVECSVKTEPTEGQVEPEQDTSHESDLLETPLDVCIVETEGPSQRDTESFVEKTEFFVDIGNIMQTEVGRDSSTSGASPDLMTRIEESCVVVKDGMKMYQCMYCGYQAARKGHLKVHIECCHQQASVQFTCDQCEYKAPRKIQLSRHIRMRHRQGVGEMLSCGECDFKTTIIEYLRKHAVKHKADAFACPHCDFRSKWKGNLKKHVRSRHEKEKSLVSKCPHCDYASTNRRTYRWHLMTKHTREEDKYRCEMCDFKTSNKEYFRKHFKLKHDDTLTVYTCEICGKYKTKSKAQLLRHTEVMHEKKEELEGNVYECSRCPFKTLRKKLMAYHVRMHDAKSIYKCAQCDYVSKFRGNLKTHVLYKHERIMVQCPQCDYKAKWKDSLKRHIETKHTDKKQELYECGQCTNYKVFHKRTLVRHIKSKHGSLTRMLKCDSCDFQTNLIEYLRKHVSYMHNVANLFQCRHCVFSTKAKHVLKKHLRVRHRVENMADTDFEKVKVKKEQAQSADLGQKSDCPNFEFVELQDTKPDVKLIEQVFVKIERLEID